MLRFAILLTIALVAPQTLADEAEMIVGGQSARPGEFPYQCSMTINNRHNCGCSIISATQVLTAAHCVHSMGSGPYDNVRIVTGTTKWQGGGQKHVIKSIHKHPQYVHDRAQSWVNDVAVITLRSSIKFNFFTAPIPLADTATAPGTQCVLSGWGRTSANGELSRDLLKMNSAIVSLNSCENVLNRPLYASHVCAFTSHGIGACQGDSGGPLVCNGKQVGIVSWVFPCGLGVPDVYSSVHYHLDFIQQMQRYA